MNDKNQYQDFLKKITKIISSNDHNFYNEPNHTDLDIFEKFNFIFQGKIKKYEKKKQSPLEKTIKELVLDKELSYILQTIYNEDGTFKTINKIINNQEDKNIINLVLSSKSYIKSIKIEKLDDNEIKYITHILENLYQNNLKELKKIQCLEKNTRKSKEKKLNKSLKEINNLRSILMNTILNKKRKSK